MTEPSATLLELARHYLEIVDSGDETRQGEERAQAHEALMDALQAELEIAENLVTVP